MGKIRALFGRLGRKAKIMGALGAMSCFAAVSSVVILVTNKLIGRG